MAAQFPARRSDGTASVGARFDVAGTGRHSLDACAAAWRETAHPDLVNALITLPFVDEVSDSEAEVVFDSGAESRFWKDAMVAFVSGVPEGAGKFIGFYDRVAGQMHRAAGFIE